MESQDPRFTTPPPWDGQYGNLYDAETPPSSQPRFPPLSLPNSQKTTQSWDSRNGPRPQISESQLTTQSWDSRDGPRPVTPDPFIRPTPSPPAPLPSSLVIPSPPLFAPDSQANSSQELSQGSNNIWRKAECTRDTRLQIQTALLFKVPIPQIKEALDITDDQIYYAKNHQLTPQKRGKVGRRAKLRTPQKQTLEQWLLSSPYHRNIAYYRIPHFLPQLQAGEKAIRTTVDAIGYCRRI